MKNERVIHIFQNLGTLEISSVLTATVKFGILKNKSKMKETLLEWEAMSNELFAEAKTANEYDEELAALDAGYKAQMDELCNNYANNHNRYITWKNEESTYVPFQIDIDEFIKCQNYSTMLVFNCYEIFVENPDNSLATPQAEG
jgi:hypothetical protein